MLNKRKVKNKLQIPENNDFNLSISGKIWKSEKDGFWLAEIPSLNLMIQSVTKKHISATVKDAIEVLVNNSSFSARIIMLKKNVYVQANDFKKLIELALKRCY